VEGRRVSGELNTPLLYAQQVHVTQIYTAYRRAIKLEFPEKTRYHNKILQEHSGLSALLQAPFKRENLTNPWVVSFALLGAGLNYAGIRFAKTERDFWNMRQVQILGDRFNREVGFGIYSAYWLPVSLGAAVSEESLFRGMVQSEWEDRWGKRKGWMFASALFGLAHYDGTGQSLGNMLFAAMAGLFLGWRFQQRDYHLSEPIAEHFWFNALAGVTLYLADPENNPLGAKVEFAF
jgi:membrane protease YdiL (CAAX protease family)